MNRQMLAKQPPKGMTILEVLVSLAILGMTIAIIGELSRIAFHNAQMARDQVQADLLAQSIMAKIQIGIINMEPVFEMPVGLPTFHPADEVFDTRARPDSAGVAPWVYSVDIVEIDDFLIEIAVTVSQNPRERQRPVVCRLVRWHALEPEIEEEEEEEVYPM